MSAGRRLLAAAVAAGGLLVAVTSPFASASSQGGQHVDDLRQATAKYFDVATAEADGYTELKDAAGIACIDSSAGGMGIHYVNPGLVGDPDINMLTPELMVYAPAPDGSLVLVASEYVVLADAWHAAHGKQPPKLFGQKFTLVKAGNRYGLPDFYELHVWLWQSNPSGLFAYYNPGVTCPTN